MKVVVTGGCGFLGTNACLYFKDKGDDVVAYDNLSKHEFSRNPYMKPEAREYNKTVLERKGVKVAVEDIRDRKTLMQYCKGADYIIHTAAQPAMTIAIEDPLLDFTTNTEGTFNVLEAARKNDSCIVTCSSIHTYGPEKINSSLVEEDTRYSREPVTIDEDEDLLCGVITPLHASKRCGEIYTQSYVDSYGLKAGCFRLTGIYGPYQFGGEDHGWVANFSIRNIIGLPITIFGNGKQLRDILFSSDVCSAFDAFYNSHTQGIFTIGGGEECMISLLECIDHIFKITSRKTDVIYTEERFGDLRYFASDYRKFNRETGWKPKVTPPEGISKLINWIKENESLFIKTV
ncbi:MAG: NAD-dependent epimerase/dehydratase family protein [Candidatus Altiarchaeota archaeon]|nr:NAD-dependent epimerase/dehydratase family protein [Candidatus Altiarchaeota archaeon]